MVKIGPATTNPANIACNFNMFSFLKRSRLESSLPNGHKFI